MPDRAALLGTWKMVSWQREVLATGERTDALGPEPVGYITYGADGRCSVIVVKRDRPPPTTLPPTEEERVRLFDSMLAYAGTYTVDEEKVVHHVDASWNQTWTGTDQVRFYQLEGDKLMLRSAPAKDPHTGELGFHLVQFERV
ncbi:lipocalin-like domain-containing protein [Microvirga ossetica]|nr:lipocalin-like domain-containing protein [Microvirga ossetica]